MMKNIKYNPKELNALLMKEVPAPIVMEKYKNLLELFEYQEEPGTHVVYADALNPYIRECLDKNNDQELIKIFNFLEILSSQRSKKVQEIVQMSILEGLIDKKKTLDRLEKYMGKKTKLLSDEIQAWWNKREKEYKKEQEKNSSSRDR